MQTNVDLVKNHRLFFMVPLSLLALLGVVAMVLATKWGIGVSPDSTTYIAAARSVLHGEGLRVPTASDQSAPMTIFAPLFPTLLAAIGIFGMDPLDAARWLNCFLFGINILSVGLIVRMVTRSLSAAILASFLFLTSPEMLNIHAMAWSEPLFFTLGMIGFITLGIYLVQPRLWLLVLASLAVSVTFLSRYAGMVFVITGAISVFLFSGTTFRKRIRDAVIFTGICLLIMSLWIARNMTVGDAPTNRHLGFHPVVLMPEYLDYLLFCLGHWIFPPNILGEIRGTIALIGVLGIMIATVKIRLDQRKSGSANQATPNLEPVFSLLKTFIFLYLVCWIAWVSFVDASLFPEARTMSPVCVAGIILIVCMGYRAMAHKKSADSLVVRTVTLLLLAAFLTSSILNGLSWAAQFRSHGKGYTSISWRQSQIMQKVKALPPGVHIYSNVPDAIIILTGRFANGLPQKIDPITLKLNGNLTSQLSLIREEAKGHKTLLVWIRLSELRWYLPSEADLSNALALTLIENAPEGSIYAIAG